MYRIQRTKDFERSYGRLKASGKFKSKTKADLTDALEMIASGKQLPAAFRDHALRGEYKGFRECHIRGDLLLVYQLDEQAGILDLVDIGTHSQLFG
jgi:mRNA interferase YafQ